MLLKKWQLPKSEMFYVWMTGVFFVIQGIIIALTSVNVPQGDEWESLRQQAFPSGFTFDYLFSFHNEHRIVFTKLVNYLFLYLTGWNLQYQVLFNYLIFASLIYFIIAFQKKYMPKPAAGIWLLPFFLAAPLLCDNHNWSFQSQFHFFLLFGFLAIFAATRQSLRTRDVISSVIFAIFSMYSFSAGMFFAVITALILGCHLFSKENKVRLKRGPTFAAISVISLAVWLWFQGYQKPPNHPEYTWPISVEFWNFFANLISLGFGFKSTNIVISLLASGFVLSAILLSAKETLTFNKRHIAFSFFSSLALLAILGSIAFSRGVYGLGQAKTSRYSEIGIFLMIFTGWLLWEQKVKSQKFKNAYKYFLGFVFLGFLGAYSYSPYFSAQAQRQDALECISRYYRGESSVADCPSSYPVPLNQFLDNAKKLNLSWVPGR